MLVDKENRRIGVKEKLAVHKKGILHRAFSILIFDSANRMLITRRAKTKYHSGGLLTNACCGHPKPNETTPFAAKKRLFEELGFRCKLKKIGSFVYFSKLDKGMFEHEYDTVFIGKYEGKINADRKEADLVYYADLKSIRNDIKKNPSKYASWFKIIISETQNKNILLKL